jgi:hypothetical protein
MAPGLSKSGRNSILAQNKHALYPKKSMAGFHSEREVARGITRGDPNDHFSCVEANDLEIGQPGTDDHDFFLWPLEDTGRFTSRDKPIEIRDQRP